MLLTAGERISMALVSMAINDLGHEAVSFTGSQAGILTDTTHGKARIVEIAGGRVHEALDEGKIAIVAGFQGVSPTTKDVTTLGRGGSDTTAVALAAALERRRLRDLHRRRRRVQRRPADRPDAHKLHEVSFEEMLAEGLCVLGGEGHDSGVVRSPHRAMNPLEMLAERHACNALVLGRFRDCDCDRCRDLPQLVHSRQERRAEAGFVGQCGHGVGGRAEHRVGDPCRLRDDHAEAEAGEHESVVRLRNGEGGSLQRHRREGTAGGDERPSLGPVQHVLGPGFGSRSGWRAAG